MPQQRPRNPLNLGKRGTKRRPAALPPLTPPPKMTPHMRTSNNLRTHISEPQTTTGLRTDTTTADGHPPGSSASFSIWCTRAYMGQMMSVAGVRLPPPS